MAYQAQIALEDTMPSHRAAVAKNRAEDDRRERIRGLLCVIHDYKVAISNNTYPHLGKGEPLQDEHRPYLEKQVREWEVELQSLTAVAA